MQADKFLSHIENEFLPYCLQQAAAKEKRNALTDKQVAMLLEKLHGDLEIQPPYVPLKPVPEKSVELAPEAVYLLKIKGQRGQDLSQLAIVNNEDELSIPDPDQLIYPCIKPIAKTVHQMYGGAYVAATLNLYAYISGKLPGFSASASAAIFKADGERFGGGTAIDEDEIFLD